MSDNMNDGNDKFIHPGPTMDRLEEVTRIEVIGYPGGKRFSTWDAADVDISIQDDGKTLKIFYQDTARKKEEVDNSVFLGSVLNLDDIPVEKLEEYIGFWVEDANGDHFVLLNVDNIVNGIVEVYDYSHKIITNVFSHTLFLCPDREVK